MSANKLGQPLSTPYKPSIIPNNDVTFRPLKQTNGNINYIALIESEREVIIEDSDYYNSDNESVDTPLETSVSPTKDIFSLGNDPIKNFYIGSVTVIGLFILYRMLNRK